MWLSGFSKESKEVSMRVGHALGFSVTRQKIKAGDTGAAGLLMDGGAQRHQQPSPTKATTCSFLSSLPHFFIHHVLAHWSYQKFQIFKAVLSIFSIYVGFYNGSWPEKVQHLPHAETGPFPVLGISVLCWSNSDSSFKMFSAAIS